MQRVTTAERNLSLGLLILRLGTGGYLATHGWGKVQMVLAGQSAMFGDPIGIGAMPSLLLVAFAEFVCAVLVMIGAATRLASIPPVVAMGVAAFVAHGQDPWTMQAAAMAFFSGASKSWASKQPALMFLTAFLALIFTGAGRYSVDALLQRARAAGAARVRA